jgi:uroporphyrinogen decarboxylase
MRAMMTPRERVRTALDHREPDRVPTALWGGPYGLVDELYLSLVETLGLGDPVAPFREGHNVSYMDDRVLERLGTDTRYVWPGASPSSPRPDPSQPEVIRDGYGQPWIRAFPYYYPDKGILVDADADDVDRLVTWPDPADPRWTSGVRERARYLSEHTDYYVIGRMVTSHGVFQTAGDLRGMERFLLDLARREPIVPLLIERVTETIDGLLRGYLGACGAYIDMIELPGDDYAGTENLLISPAMFREHFKPALRRLVETVKGFRSDLKVMFHSDGAIEPLIPDLVEVGIDAIHPLEPLPAMDPVAVKAAHGGRIAFVGGIDIVRAMPGSQQDVVEEVRRRIGQLAPGGGYLLAPANHLQGDVPPENVVALYEAAHRYGTLPISGAG